MKRLVYPRVEMKKPRDPKPEEINDPLFLAVWECIKGWDIATGFDIDDAGNELYSGATGNHVVAILDSLKATCLEQLIDIMEGRSKCE